MDLGIGGYANAFNSLAVGCGDIIATVVLIELPQPYFTACEVLGKNGILNISQGSFYIAEFLVVKSAAVVVLIVFTSIYLSVYTHKCTFLLYTINCVMLLIV